VHTAGILKRDFWWSGSRAFRSNKVDHSRIHPSKTLDSGLGGWQLALNPKSGPDHLFQIVRQTPGRFSCSATLLACVISLHFLGFPHSFRCAQATGGFSGFLFVFAVCLPSRLRFFVAFRRCLFFLPTLKTDPRRYLFNPVSLGVVFAAHRVVLVMHSVWRPVYLILASLLLPRFPCQVHNKLLFTTSGSNTLLHSSNGA